MATLVFPILNKSTSFFPGPTFYLSDKVWLSVPSDEQFGAMSKIPDDYSDLLFREQRCIFIEIPAPIPEDFDRIVSKFATRLRYTFNIFRAEAPLLLSFAILISEKVKGKTRSHVYSGIGPDGFLPQSSDTSFRLKTDAKRPIVHGFFDVLSKATERHRKLSLTLGRFNSALSRIRPTDKIVDITMSLESLIQDDKNELAFKFALYNSVASTADPAKRHETYELLKKLYIARSTIVHGGAQDEGKEEKLVAEISRVWLDVETYARNAINYQVFYMAKQEPKKWMEHMLLKVLGVPTTPEATPEAEATAAAAAQNADNAVEPQNEEQANAIHAAPQNS